MDATTLRLISRVRVAALLAQHEAGGVASLWQIERAFMPGTAAWILSWPDPGDRQARGAPTSTWPSASSSSTRSHGRRRSTGSAPPQVRAVDAVGVVVG